MIKIIIFNHTLYFLTQFKIINEWGLWSLHTIHLVGKKFNSPDIALANSMSVYEKMLVAVGQCIQ